MKTKTHIGCGHHPLFENYRKKVFTALLLLFVLCLFFFYTGCKKEDSPSNLTPNPAMGMSEDVFWHIIGLFDWEKTGDDKAVIEPAVKALAQMTVDDIKGFYDIMSEKLHALDTEAHAREIGEHAYQPNEYFSPDWFLYVRCCVVANGRKMYELILSDPTEMLQDMEFEFLLSVAPDAFERKTGEEFDHVSPVSFETYSNRAGWINAQALRACPLFLPLAFLKKAIENGCPHSYLRVW